MAAITARLRVLAKHKLASRMISRSVRKSVPATPNPAIQSFGVCAIFGVGLACTCTCEEQRDDSQKVSARTVQLVVTKTPSQGQQIDGPVLVLVHGLDSWRGTWRRTADELARRGFSSISVDQRGHGESPLGSPEDFGPAQLAADLRAAVRSAGLLNDSARFALVGHSMGGLIAMRYAADYPQDLTHLIIEDIDCVPWGDPPPSSENLTRMQHFNRHFPSWEACRADLLAYGYEEKRMQGWRKENPPRVFDCPSGGVWSAINPHAQHLATTTVGNSTNGLESLSRLAAMRVCGKADFPVHLFVAGRGICDWDALPGGVHDMASILPGLQITKFPDAYHSIHNTALTGFVDSLEKIIRTSSS